MNKILFLTIFVLAINFSLAIPQINLYGSEQTQPNEMISGNIVSVDKTLTSGDLRFFEGRREVSFEKDIVGFEGKYYFYVIFNREGNFTLKIQDIIYSENGSLKSMNLEKNFEVKKNNETNLSRILLVKPGIFSGFSEAEISLTNKGELDLNVSYGKNKTSVAVGKTEKITLKPNSAFSLIEIKSYKSFFVPVIFYNFENTTKNESFSTPTKVPSLRTQKNAEIVSYVDDSFSLEVELFNFGIENLSEVSVKSNLSFLNFIVEKNIEARNIVNLTISGIQKEKGSYLDNLSISYIENNTSENIFLPLAVFIFEKNVSEAEKQKSFSCFDLGGKICADKTSCSSGQFSDKIPDCCIGGGLCVEKEDKKSGSGGTLFGLIILVFLGAVGYVIYKKFKNVKPKQKIIS